ncbi:hypothetical protein M404DRAFT_858034 [Pisolithus tinctorius Marx 270]|uniref:Uncharacterized protein n=1 Tax=Pisolithus tinctorius Marx 270 TaxID=870435 RepID=A0A0C3JKQ1_PISTI|nr:hypothetical protein M404DRAFT_858034 [Pisolithus tinctorius Marx 270]
MQGPNAILLPQEPTLPCSYHSSIFNAVRTSTLQHINRPYRRISNPRLSTSEKALYQRSYGRILGRHIGSGRGRLKATTGRT